MSWLELYVLRIAMERSYSLSETVPEAPGEFQRKPVSGRPHAPGRCDRILKEAYNTRKSTETPKLVTQIALELGVGAKALAIIAAMVRFDASTNYVLDEADCPGMGSVHLVDLPGEVKTTKHEATCYFEDSSRALKYWTSNLIHARRTAQRRNDCSRFMKPI